MKKQPIRVLVTAVGSPLGQSIIKALRLSSLPIKIFVSDISPMAGGFFMGTGTAPIILPSVRDKNFDRVFKQMILKHRITCIFPVLEIEHDYFHREKSWFDEHHVQIVTDEKEILDRCYDKFTCMTYLSERDIAVPDTLIGKNGKNLQTFMKTHPFPLFLKPRFGASNTDTFVVHTQKELNALLETRPKRYFILQTYLPDLPEYTVGVYRSRDGTFERTCVIQRELKFGLSYKGTVIRNQIISDYALSVARALELTFSSNIQLRLKHGVPYAFEVNPRLSSTTSVRAHFGFNEPEMILLELYSSLTRYSKKLKTGSFVRLWEEHYLPPSIHL